MAPDRFRHNAGPYVLGVLDPTETTAFEEHLIACDGCAVEVETLLPSVVRLGEVSPNQAIVLHMIHGPDPVEPTVVARRIPWRVFRRASTALHRRGLFTPRHGRAPSRALFGPRRTMRVARAEWRRRGALTAIAGAGVILSFLLSVQLSAGGESSPHATSPPGPATGGPSTAGLEVTDPQTRVHAVLTITDAPWGSQLWLTLDTVYGPLRCELVATGHDGVSTVVASWLVPELGYGVDGSPDPLTIQATTATRLRDIRELVVQATPSSGGPPFVLVTLAL